MLTKHAKILLVGIQNEAELLKNYNFDLHPLGVRARRGFMLKKQATHTARLQVRQLTTIGMLSAITVVLGTTGTGFVQLPIAKATIMHIPVIIGAIVEGPAVGAFIGLMFGLSSILQNILAPNILSYMFLNPLVSVLPRVLIGITTYYTYKLLSAKLNKSFSIAVGTAVGSFTNTVGVLGMIYLLYAQEYANAKNIIINNLAKTLLGVAGLNGTIEAIIAVIVVVPIVFAVVRLNRNK